MWGLQTYKKDRCQLQAERNHKLREYVSSRVTWNTARAIDLPHVRFVRYSNAKLKAILKRYFQQVGVDATRFINWLWNSITGSRNVDSFLEKHELDPFYGRMLKSFHRIEHLGDFLLAGRSLCDAFDTYSCSIYIRVNLMGPTYFLEENNLIGLVIKCGRAAESCEQKKLAFELLEFCLLSQSMTGLLTDTVSKSLQQYYTDEDSGQKCHIEPRIGNCPGDMVLKLYSRILPTSITMYKSISSLLVVTKQSELYLPTQHAIYAHLWRKLHVGFSDGEYDDEPNLQLCEILATSSHVLAQDMLERNSGKLSGSSETGGSISVRDTLSRMFQSELCSIEILDKLHHTTKFEEACFLDSLQARYWDDSHVHAQCMHWLKLQALTLINSCASLNITQCLPPSIVLHNLTDDTDAMDTGMAFSMDCEPSSKSKDSIYLCSSSMPSSMHSMRSMASRIKRHTGESARLSMSQMSGNSMAMSISGSFDFSRVTGMGSATPSDHRWTP